MNMRLKLVVPHLWIRASNVLYFQRCGLFFSPAQVVRKLPSSAIFSQAGRVAQLAEHSALNRQVEGSIPSASTSPLSANAT
jgi:hypothetical protein